VHESASDLAALDDVLARSAAGAGAHLRAAFDSAAWLSASELCEALPGIVEVHLAVLAGDGAPLVAPVDGIWFRGGLWIGLPAASLRARLVVRDPRVSVSFVSDAVSFILHGAFVVAADDAFAAHARSLYVAQYGEWFGEVFDRQTAVGAGVGGVVEPRVMFAKS